ncbi:G-protein coupled receptor Mth2-like [Neocloeon triangulifer]|uniref:G-protein coupled receptor Mth2-like n=1 Tax=Neocloeon triangulifer TaxID=2078957 RepID=UPI00286F66B5|nr:G-protein coupled receptor Mth2-like [Neocloeon triangulifer]
MLGPVNTLFILFTTFLISLSISAEENVKPCLVQDSVLIQKFHIFPNKTLLDTERKLTYAPHQYFREGNSIRGCVCLVKKCIRKCCAEDHHIKNGSTECVPRDGGFGEFRTSVFRNLLPPKSANDEFYFLTGLQNCPQSRFRLYPDESPDDKFTLLANGDLKFLAEEEPIDVSMYCVEHFGDVDYVSAILCFPEEPSNQVEGALINVYAVGMLLSTVFIAITLLVYVLLPQLRNLHGKCLMCHVGCLLAAYLSLSIVQLGTETIPGWLCTFIPFVIQFTFSAAFFWLNIMCFDICWMFNRVHTISGSSAERERKKLCIYSTYAWGCPLLLLTVCIIADLTPGLPNFIPRPRFGEHSCWYSPIGDKSPVLVYFFGPISILLIMNLILFIRTAMRIVSLRKGTGMLNRNDSQSSSDKQQKFVLYLKLFIVMGLSWIMEVISFLVKGPTYMWLLTDVCNTLQGLAIFLIFVWKPKVRRLLRERLCPGRGMEQQNTLVSAGGANHLRKISSNTKVEELSQN